MNLTEELYSFCESNQVNLIGAYENVKKTTPIYFHCSQCNRKQKKSYKCLTEYKNTQISVWAPFCPKCFKRIHY